MTDTIVFTFGRFQPPGKNHEKLVKKLIEVSKKEKADHIIFLSQTRNRTTDPLDWSFKLRICEASFPGVKISKDHLIKTPFQALESLSARYKNIILIVGSDRVNEFSHSMAPYVDRWGIERFGVVDAGVRDDSDTLSGMSGTKLRNFALSEDKDSFIKWLPDRLSYSLKEEVYNRIKNN